MNSFASGWIILFLSRDAQRLQYCIFFIANIVKIVAFKSSVETAHSILRLVFSPHSFAITISR